MINRPIHIATSLGKRPGHAHLRWVVSPEQGDRESVKNGSVDLTGRKPPVQIASIGVEISFNALD